jgi:hypothetical protein
LGDDFWAPLANRLQELKRDITTQISKVEEEIQLSDSIRARISLLEELRKVDKCPLCNSVHEVTESKILDEINHLKSNLEDNNLTDINALKRKLVDFETFNFNFNSFIEIRNLQKEFDADGADLAVSTQKLDDKQNQLLLFGNVDILDLVTSIKSVVEDKKTAENELSQYLQDEIVLSRKITKYESDIGKGISPQKRIAHNAFSYLVNLFEEAKEDYVFLVRNQVESFASETFLKIISDKKYQGLRINDNFGVDLILPDGNLDPLRSTGQGKVSTIALVSGLIRTAMDEGFILMDTPFVSLDLGHREAVCKWAAESGFRVSLFMHSGEFVWERDRMAFGDSIGRVYRIKKISKDESTIELETA